MRTCQRGASAASVAEPDRASGRLPAGSAESVGGSRSDPGAPGEVADRCHLEPGPGGGGPVAGSYFFRCDVHPDMQGTLVATP